MYKGDIMSQPNNKKLSILYILNILKTYSDENHLLTQADIAKKLYSLYGMECERKSISANIDSLIDYGYDIVKSSNGCYLASRELEPSEVVFLTDAVFSSRSVSSKHAKELSSKLQSFLSVYNRKKHNYVYKADEINRSANKQLFYNIEVIEQAISEGKQIRFNYNRYYFNPEKNKRKSSKSYVVNPYFMINNQGKYYLVCNYDYFDEIANYKLDLITNIEIVDNAVKPITQVKGFENGIDIAKYVNENVYMFGGKSIVAKIKILDDYVANYVNEWFGSNASFYTVDDELFATIHANEESLVYWCMQYSKSVVLITPTDTRERIKNMLQQALNNYNN